MQISATPTTPDWCDLAQLVTEAASEWGERRATIDVAADDVDQGSLDSMVPQTGPQQRDVDPRAVVAPRRGATIPDCSWDPVGGREDGEGDPAGRVW